ncbi:helix-turn-helix transcriptional regulator [Lysinibacillus louembei]|uniref:Helix-turn-helix transcriptional regulator n=1 Tax=Lysinibacillus louembei TaxID=1470088 RepID=A0ABZ0S115_9BACI|nr:helix-turn-helix transcriptional regulator [Lysinibacillus louembei]WPK13390.1 helix-turn-helix transcriptional regulator [Lysinibacillus louembei]
MKLGEKIRSKRIELQLTQQQLADKVFVTRQTIFKWELDKSIPDPLTLTLLENALNSKLHAVDVSQTKGVQNMRLLQNILGVLLFGILFLPFRMGGVFIKKGWSNPLVRFIVIPILIVGYLLYINSLNMKAFYLIVGFSIALYLTTSVYFYSNNAYKES